MTDVSPQQWAANQENAQQSTGPKTEEGKAVSRYNAIKHGLLSKEVLIRKEDENALLELEKRMRSELSPATELELMLVDRITANFWRLRRLLQVEREMIEKDRAYDGFDGSKKMKTLGVALSSDFGYKDTYGKLIRYEASIERGIYKALHELERTQATRRGEKPPLPIAIDVDVSGDAVPNGFVSQ